MEEKKSGPQEKPAAQTEPAPKPKKDPTRYGDWEIGGRCIDF